MAGRILLVEDNVPLRRALTALLVHRGYEVSEAPDGRIALEMLMADPLPDVILLDVGLPVMDGHEFRRRQLADDRLAKIATIVMSGNDEGANAAEFPGATLFAKGGSPERVLELIAAACPNPGKARR